MQERRFRPGDVLDDYCPRERRITDHAIVAMIDEEIRRTRCGICDAEHEYKEAKVPAPRRKTPPPALFTQVLDGLQGPGTRPHSPPAPSAPAVPVDAPIASDSLSPPPATAPLTASAVPAETAPLESPEREDGPVRRPLIRATFPKREGQEPIPRALPEFTVQTLNNRGGRPGGGSQRPGGGGQGKGRGRRRPGGGAVEHYTGPMRSSRDQGPPGFGYGNGNGDGQGRPQGQGQGQGQGGRRRRGGKKNR
jgi:hypothetical protein